MTLHRKRTHPVHVDGCFACHLSSLHINHSSEFKRIEGSESTLAKDLDAYKRLRKNGVQPPTTTGAAKLEREAKSEFDVNHANNPALTALTPSQRSDFTALTGKP